eukprot:TRINITY_DN8539_c0_g1_i3.p1 TRINITY_DN8539_c0_g1~~TRINITY_DN8539_c0_g1_i3.p1  ORF type:complete len:238 (+),score=50.31 TRINITY_DN8539_c0_g1_i3:341-1054(+)
MSESVQRHLARQGVPVRERLLLWLKGLKNPQADSLVQEPRGRRARGRRQSAAGGAGLARCQQQGPKREGLHRQVSETADSVEGETAMRAEAPEFVPAFPDADGGEPEHLDTGDEFMDDFQGPTIIPEQSIVAASSYGQLMQFVPCIVPMQQADGGMVDASAPPSLPEGYWTVSENGAQMYVFLPDGNGMQHAFPIIMPPPATTSSLAADGSQGFVLQAQEEQGEHLQEEDSDRDEDA